METSRIVCSKMTCLLLSRLKWSPWYWPYLAVKIIKERDLHSPLHSEVWFQNIYFRRLYSVVNSTIYLEYIPFWSVLPFLAMVFAILELRTSFHVSLLYQIKIKEHYTEQSKYCNVDLEVKSLSTFVLFWQLCWTENSHVRFSWMRVTGSM